MQTLKATGLHRKSGASVQQELGWNVLAQIGYVGTLTIHQHTRYNINYGLPGGGQASQQLYKPFGITANETVIEPFEHQNYNSLQAQIEKRLSNGLQLHAAYTWSRFMGTCCDDRGDGEPDIPIPQYFYLNYAVMPNDRTNVFQLSSVYQLPFGKDKQFLTSGVGAAIAGGWQANAILSFYSGLPFSVTDPGTSLNAPGSTQRANQVKRQVAIYGSHGLASPYFDISAFAPVTTPTFGTASFDSLRGPGFSNMDLEDVSVFVSWKRRHWYQILRIETPGTYGRKPWRISAPLRSTVRQCSCATSQGLSN